jgi:hypothetical protein
MQRGIDFTAPDFSTDTIYRLLGFEPEPLPHVAIQGARLEMAVFRDLASRGIFVPAPLVMGGGPVG